MDKLNKEQIIELLPHREPMLLIDELINIKKLFSATAISIAGERRSAHRAGLLLRWLQQSHRRRCGQRWHSRQFRSQSQRRRP